MNEPETILVVDDDKFNITLLRELCETAGYNVLEARNGDEALSLLNSEDPDLVLLDVMMPGKDGFQVCRQIRNTDKTAHIPVIVVTALDDLNDKVRGIEVGADDYVTKPFRLFELQKRIRVAIDSRRYRRQIREVEEKLKKLGDLEVPGRIGGFRHLRFGLEYEFQRAQRYQHALSCLLIDIDGYDEIASERGSRVAAEKISILVTVLQNTLRIVDRIYRIDQGQFLVLLPETNTDGTKVAYDRICRQLRNPPKDVCDPITLSTVLGSFPHPNVSNSKDMLRLLSQKRREYHPMSDTLVEIG